MIKEHRLRFPAANVKIYILDKELNPIPDGEIGEIYISSDGVGRGYFNKLDLTCEEFINNPFVSGYRIYKTVDLARRLQNGYVEYILRSRIHITIFPVSIANRRLLPHYSNIIIRMQFCIINT